MGIFRNIWNTIFGKSNQENSFERGGSIAEVPMKVIYKKNKEEKLERGRTYTENELGEPQEKQETVGGYNTKDTKFTPNNVCNPNVALSFNTPLVKIPNTLNVCNPVITPNHNNPLIEIPNGDDFFVSNDLIAKEEKMDSEVDNLPKKEKVNNVIGKKTLSEIKEYLIKYGSLDVLTCEQKFKVKSLHNFIWYLRKEGLVIKTQKVGLHNELGEKIEVTNYKLISVK